MSDALARLKQACARVEAPHRRGTAYLIAPDLAMTCAHVVEHASQPEDVQLHFLEMNAPLPARIMDRDTHADWALLHLNKPLDRQPLPLSLKDGAAGAEWLAYGFPEIAGTAGLPLKGGIADPDGRDRWNRPALVLSCPMADGGQLHGFSGAPLLVNGRVAGHLRYILWEDRPDAPRHPPVALTTVYATASQLFTQRLPTSVGAASRLADATQDSDGVPPFFDSRVTSLLKGLAEILGGPIERSSAELFSLTQKSGVQVAQIDWVGPLPEVCRRAANAAYEQDKIESLCETLLAHDNRGASHSRVESWRESWQLLPTAVRHPINDKLILYPGTLPFPRIVSPSVLLVARYGVVPFTGREEECRELDEWANSGATVRVRLIYGEGGAGKTRLAIEWAKKRRDECGDMAGFLPDLEEVRREQLLSVDSAIVVIDYAESQHGLGPLFDSLVHGGAKGRLRILMLARQPGDWLRALQERSTAVGMLLDEVRHLHPLCGHKIVEREGEYQRALPFFREQVDRHEIAIEDQQRRDSDEKPDFSQRRYERVLYLHMAALAKVMGLKLTHEAYGLLTEILHHEARLWTKRANVDEAEEEVRRDFVEQAAMALAMVTLRGAMSRRRFEELSDELVPDAHLRRKLGRLFVDLYPAGEGGIGPLEPDILGEALLLKVQQRGLM